MAIDLGEMLDPARTAVLTSEVQNGVVGEQSPLPQLAEAARGQAIPNIARLCQAARGAGVQVVHCVAMRRSDGKGSNANARLFLGVRKSPTELLPGTSEVAVVPELGPADEDLVLSRLHGLNPMAGTDLDPVLRNLGVRTLVVTGVSVNVAVTNPQAAVVGVPDDRLGEVGVAVVVPAHGAAPLAESDLIGWCRERMANFKVPRRVLLMDVLPLNASGKVLKHELRVHAAAGLGGST